LRDTAAASWGGAREKAAAVGRAALTAA
jgi:hypothetical protein